ncbi:hypothetical protein [Deinococcus yavapaiensis]|uniref:Uncharacterized protein n=1 Tax=Deinococcus yavapaiensis KR-236 TaxID=694435 RepID=A0A318S3J5_9DEIO|nr:hypothetical protein [Deinococcus yavapaiensis]PYE53088.1 hypothetical protein DES52_11071 [Deinococcus yavapaiensis KR-236]
MSFVLRCVRVLPALTVLSSCLASAAVPSAVAGEWFTGRVFTPATYAFGSSDFKNANGSSRRLVLNANGTYEQTVISSTMSAQGFGMSTYLISCESLNVAWERGTFKVAGSTLTLQPAQAKGVNGSSPSSLNNGCTRFNGFDSGAKVGAPRAYSYKLQGGALHLTASNASLELRRATPADLPAPAPAASNEPVYRAPLPSERRPVYEGATGKWTTRFVTSDGQPLDARVVMDDDRGVAGTVYGLNGAVLGNVSGNSASGRLEVTLYVDDATTLVFRVQGAFDGDHFKGSFTAFDRAGGEIGGGTVTMERAR